MNNIHLSNADVIGHTQDILRQMQVDGWTPDYIVGLTRGGLIPAVYISQYLNCPLETLKVSIRSGKLESNFWMSEDTFNGANVLIVDDINDTGETLNWIVNDWQSGCLPNDPKWNDIWGKSVRFAVLVDNEASKFNYTVNYSAKAINKSEDPRWIIFPWEEWWLHKK